MRLSDEPNPFGTEAGTSGLRNSRRTNRTLLGAKGIATRSKKLLVGAPGLTTSNKKLLETRTLQDTHICAHLYSGFNWSPLSCFVSRYPGKVHGALQVARASQSFMPSTAPSVENLLRSWEVRVGCARLWEGWVELDEDSLSHCHA